MNSQELAWATGLFEGEGSTFFAKTSSQIWVTISMTDLEPLQRFKDAVDGLGSIDGPYQYDTCGHKKPVWRYRSNRLETVQSVVLALWSWLGTTKRLQVLEAFQAYWSFPRSPRPSMTCPKGHTWDDPNNIYLPPDGRRRCKPCRRQRYKEYYRRRKQGEPQDVFAAP